MSRLIVLAVSVCIFLLSTISYAGDKLSSSEKNFLFSSKEDVAVSVIDETEINSTQGNLIFQKITISGLVIQVPILFIPPAPNTPAPTSSTSDPIIDGLLSILLNPVKSGVL